MCLSALIGLGAAFVGASSASKAAKAQTSAANNQLQLQERMYDESSANFEPYLASGQTSLNALMYELGLGPKPTSNNFSIEEIPGAPNTQVGALLGFGAGSSRFNAYAGGDNFESSPQDRKPWAMDQVGPSTFKVGDRDFSTREEAQSYLDTQGTEYQGFELSPGANYMLESGRDTIESGASASGKLFSGASGTALEKFRHNLVSGEVNTYLNRLTGVAQMGQASAAGQATASTNFATGGSAALANIGNAGAAGAIGIGNAITDGINTGIGAYGYFNGLDSFQPNISTWTPG